MTKRLVSISADTPQLITHVESEETVTSKQLLSKLSPKKILLTELIRISPLFGMDIDLDRDKSIERNVDL